MKLISFGLFLFFFISCNAQLPKNGTYTYKYCDEEYNKCLETCKIKIKEDSIWIYAPANLSGIKEGELLEKGKLVKHKTGKWMITTSEKDKKSKIVGGCEGPAWIDFKKKKFWYC
ncbi:MAG: hypothetical protein V4685_14095 [Bacteroidota bacterium]